MVARPKVSPPAYGMMAAALAALPLGDWSVLLVSVGLACGISHGILMPVIYAPLLFGVPRDRRGWAVALLVAAFDLGNVLSGVGLGLAAETLGSWGIFPLAAGAVLLGAATSHRWGGR